VLVALTVNIMASLETTVAESGTQFAGSSSGSIGDSKSAKGSKTSAGHTCSYCQKVFDRQFRLDSHMRSHTGEVRLRAKGLFSNEDGLSTETIFMFFFWMRKNVWSSRPPCDPRADAYGHEEVQVRC
jgi:hypothetical protein